MLPPSQGQAGLGRANALDEGLGGIGPAEEGPARAGSAEFERQVQVVCGSPVSLRYASHADTTLAQFQQKPLTERGLHVELAFGNAPQSR